MQGRESGPPACAHCGSLAGVYERLRWVRPDGSVVDCGWLTAREDPRHAHPQSRFFHSACFDAAIS